MNRNPKHAPPSEALKKAKATLFFRVDRSKVRDCAFCRNSEARGKGFICKLQLAMDAPNCPRFKDARMPSELVPHTVEFR